MRVPLIFIFTLSLFISKADFVTDTIQSILNCKGSDSIIIARLTTFGRSLKNTPSKAIEALAELRNYSEKAMSKRDLATCCRKIGVIYGDLNNFDKALEFSLKSVQLFNELNDNMGAANCYNNIANYYQSKGGITGDTIFLNRSLEYHLRNIQIRKEFNDTSWLYISYSNASIAYIRLKRFDEAIQILKLGVDYYKTRKDDQGSMLLVNSNLGDAYLGKARENRKPEYFRKALSYFVNIVSEYSQQKNIINEEYADALEKTGEIYYETEQYARSLENLTSAFNIYNEMRHYEGLSTSTLRLAKLFEKEKEFEKSNEFYRLHLAYKDTVLNKLNKNNVEQMQMLYKSSQKDNEIVKLKHDKEIQEVTLNRQRTITFATVGGLLLILLLGFVLLSRYNLKRKANMQLTDAFTKIEIKNREITDSINYAKRIQNSILPPNELLISHLPDFFLFYSPKDIVSGDFYWFTKHDDKLFFVLADCTGHGVPGALMSMIGNTLLNEIINQKDVTDPGEILNLLDKGISNALRQQSTDIFTQDDGMDVSICRIDEKNKGVLTYASANHTLFIKNKNGLAELTGDIYSIGGSIGGNKKCFKSKEVKIESESFIVLSSDGYSDQFGGKNNTKFLVTRFEDLILKTEFNSANAADVFKTSFENWKGGNQQTDDVLVAGFRLS